MNGRSYIPARRETRSAGAFHHSHRHCGVFRAGDAPRAALAMGRLGARPRRPESPVHGQWPLAADGPRRLDLRLDPGNRPLPAVGDGDPARGGCRAGLSPRQIDPAARLAHRAGGARRRHRGLGRRTVFWPAELGQAAGDPQGDVDGRGTSVPRRAGQQGLRDDRRLGHSPQPRGSFPGGMGVSQIPGVPRHADRQGVWRPRVFGAGAEPDRQQDSQSLGGCRHHRHGAQLARAGRTAREVRYPRAKGEVSPPPCHRAGGSLLCAHRSLCRFGRRQHARCRDRHLRSLPGQEDPRGQGQLGQALHYSRADRDPGRARLPVARSGPSDWGRGQPRHYPCVDPSEFSGRRDRPPAFSGARGVHEWPDQGSQRLHPDGISDRRHRIRRTGLADADGMPFHRTRHLAAGDRHHLDQTIAAGDLRLRADPPAVRHLRRRHGRRRRTPQPAGPFSLHVRGGARAHGLDGR